jgi:hypothetical protein
MTHDAQLPGLGEMLERAVTFATGFVAAFLPFGIVAFGAIAALALLLVPLLVAALVAGLAGGLALLAFALVRGVARRLPGRRRR